MCFLFLYNKDSFLKRETRIEWTNLTQIKVDVGNFIFQYNRQLNGFFMQIRNWIIENIP